MLMTTGWDRIKSRLNKLPDSHYCPTCQHPLRSDGCYVCINRRRQDKRMIEGWIEKIGGEKAWKEYLEACFIRTAYNSSALDAAKAFVYTKQSIIFCGPRGTGKSHLAAIIKRPLIIGGIETLTVSMPEVLGRVRAFIKDGKVLDDEVRRLVNVKVLSIEDVGVEKPSDWVCEFYYRVIDGRYREARHGMILTMNSSLDQLEAAWSRFDSHGRVASRLREMCQVHSLVGERDWRSEKSPS